MDERTLETLERKPYTKPEIQQVRLFATRDVLDICWVSGTTSAESVNCGTEICSLSP